MIKKAGLKTDLSTEEKIKEAAREVFSRKGYSATRTRDIAEQAGLNLALLNYYFRTKEKLFEIIMTEKIQKYFGVLGPVLNNASTTLESKVESITSKYIDLILENPELPLFVLSEMRNKPEHFVKIIEKTDFLTQSEFIKQIKKRRPDIHPLQFFVSLLGMCIFPFLMRPALQIITQMKDEEFKKMMLARKKLIPVWVRAMLKAK